MRFFDYLYLTTLVLLAILLAPRSSLASTESPSPDFTEPTQIETVKPQDQFLKTSLDISPAPPALKKNENDEFFYSFRHGLTIRAGALYDSQAGADGKANPLIELGAQYLFTYDRLKSIEAGADLLSDGTGVLHVERRFEFSRTRFRPFLKAGAGLRVEPADQLATFLKYQNYQIRAAAGFDDLIRLPASLRLEVETSLSPKTWQFGLSLGAVWAY